MSKNSDFESPKKIEQYQGSSSGAVWIVVAVSAVLAIVAVFGASSIT